MRVPSTQVQNNFGKYLKFAEANEEVIITRKGKDVARLMPIDQETVREETASYHTSGSRVAYEEFLELVEASEQRFELIDGVVYNLASPSFRHQHIVHELHGAFYNWFKGKPCTPLTSPFDIAFDRDPDNICVVQPDLVVICDRENRDKKDRYTGVPALTVEVLSPATRSKDMLVKLNLYKRCGVREYWIVDPMNEQIMVYLLENDDISDSKMFVNRPGETVVSFVFDGLRIAMCDIFAGN